ncbi:hypothetical protein NS115_05210 [Paenibacillus jamilae]|uniref:Uncharacterized protein n=1 Tax=Paenibacillus jamilae TaxID=114136 RepID=A0ACC4ZYD0_9BACL|nr:MULTISPECIES: N-6 DNA methylase [Paenibacillus]KTS83931.1 hypothetical protein NS115_05210 [Paenibacillus jamilae]
MAFEKGKNQNKLTDKNINKIIETYRNRVDVDKYAHVASLEEIEQDKQEIAELEARINEQLKILGIDV